MSRIVFTFGTKPPPNTPDRAKRRKIEKDLNQIGGVRDTLQWGGNDNDRMKLRRTKTKEIIEQFNKEAASLDPPRRIAMGDPDFTTYVPSWGLTIPNKTEKPFSMKDTLQRNEYLTARERNLRSYSPMRLTDYGGIPFGLERQKSNALIRQIEQHKRPGLLETINAADHAIRHIQAKKEREEESYDNVIDYHKQRYNHVMKEANPAYNPEKFLDTLTPDPFAPSAANQSWNKENWKSSMSRQYRKGYEDILDDHMAQLNNSTNGVVRNFYKGVENDLATKTDLRRYHHVI